MTDDRKKAAQDNIIEGFLIEDASVLKDVISSPLSWALLALLVVTAIMPVHYEDANNVDLMKSKVKELNCPRLSDKQGEVLSDGKVSSSEYSGVMSSVMSVEIMGCEKALIEAEFQDRKKYPFEEI